MAIVISGVNNNDKITASDGTIDLLSGVNYVGVLTAPSISAGHLNIGSGIQLGNAGIITATTLVGNVTGNINHTSNLLLQISGSEKFRVGTSGQLGIGGANYGTSGQVLTSGGSGSAATWSTVTGTTINSNAANRIITGSGTANTLEGNSNFTYTGSVVTHNNPSGLAKLDVKGSVGGGALGASISVRNTNSANNGSGEFQFQDPGSNIFAKIVGVNLTDGSNNGYMTFHTASATAGLVERLRITDDGTIKQTSTTAFQLASGTTAQRPSAVTGMIRYNTTFSSLEFYNGSIWVATNLIPLLNSVTGDILNGSATNLVINASNITDSVSVKYSNNSSGSVIATDSSPSISGSNVTSTVPSAVYGTSAGTVVKIEIINSDGTVSSNSLTKTIVAAPSGGSKTTAGGYTYHTFTSNGNFVNTLSSLSVEFLLVAGGGGGGSGDDGFGGGTGGGAGGAIDGTATLSAATYAIQIGAGGAGGKRVSGPAGENGGNSTFNGNTAIGGGRGSDAGVSNHPGGVGSGGDIPNGFSGGSGCGGFRGGNPGAGTSGQGNAGGNGGGAATAAAGGGGGGGKGAVGGNANVGVGGNGGAGINWKSLGTSYAGGGGGGGDNTASQTATAGSGTDGGGNGTPGGTGSDNTNHASANRGGGGGGTGGNTGTFYRGSNGGSGICIIRYQL